MEQRLNFEFRSFLLQLGRELSLQDLEHLKFILTPYVSSAECDKMSFCAYFEELKRRCHLSRTNFGILKNGLNEIGREDLVEKIVLKELSKRKNFIKRRKSHLMNQKRSGFWQALHKAYCNCFQVWKKKKKMVTPWKFASIATKDYVP